MEASNSIDKSWIHLVFPNQRFINGVSEFLKYAKTHHRNKNIIPCPCGKCRNQGRALKYDVVEEHCYRHGFDKTYKVWFVHGEQLMDSLDDENALFENMSGDNMTGEEENVNGVDMNDVYNTLFENMNGDNLDTILENNPTETENIIDDVDFNANLREAMSELYPGCQNFTVLKFIVKLFNLKITHGISNSGFNELLEIMRMVLPLGNKTPKNTYMADKVIKDLGLKYEKIDACRNDCILYWEQHKSKDKCPTCGVSRYKMSGIEQFKKRTRSPAKVLRYFPLTDRLKRLYSVEWVANEMRWHSTGQSMLGKLGHPVDSAVWKKIDSIYPDFASEPRNVRLGLATDGFNPYSAQSASYSSWPVMCVTYNLPPGLCMKRQFTMLTALIDGPRQPGKDIDVYLQPLVRELQNLWHHGKNVRDASKDEVFNMRAVLLWTIHDLPAYGNISGCRTKGKNACPCCGPRTASIRLHHGKKEAYMRHRRWFPLLDEIRNDVRESTFDKTKEKDKQPTRLTGIEVDELTKNMKMSWGKGKKKKRNDDNQENIADLCFCKRSIFFELEYWKYIPIRHNLDVMHIEKNVCELLLAMMLNTKGKTKDNIKARKDLKRMKIKKRYWLSKVNGKIVMKPGIFWLSKDEKNLFFQSLRNLRVPIGFSGNWSSIVKGDSLDLKGLKSHDYHILMEYLLPMLIQHAYRDGARKEARTIIKSFCTYFSALCSKRVDIQTLNVLERGMVKTLCALERLCPPSLFVIMMHLPIHLAQEARICGPVQYRWMFCFERMMKYYKGYVTNKAQPEACIAERYLREETLNYCSGYKRGGGLLQKLDRMAENASSSLPDLIDGINDDSNVNEVGPVGAGHAYKLVGVEYEQARNWMIKSHGRYEYWNGQYIEYIETTRAAARRRIGQSRQPILDDFIPWLKKQPEFLESGDAHFKDIVRGPTTFAKTYNKYCVNGFLFATKDSQASKKNQNSGVSTKCLTTFRSSAKDKNPIDGYADYYGVLKKIIEIEYREGYKCVLFKSDWVKSTQTGIKIDEVAGLMLVNLSNLYSSVHMNDEPFILADRATQVFYSQDPKDPDWSVVLEVPRKVYSDEDEFLLSDEKEVNESDVGPTCTTPTMEDELIFNDSDDLYVVESSSGRKRSRRQ